MTTPALPEVKLRELFDEVAGRVEARTKEELFQCARVLAIHLAIYKRSFGDIDVESAMENTDDAGKESLPACANVTAANTSANMTRGAEMFVQGLQELAHTLALVEAESVGAVPTSRTIN